MIFTRWPREDSFPISRALGGTCCCLSRFCNILLQELTPLHVKITRSYEFVEPLPEETQIIDLFTHCKLQPHKLSQYMLAKFAWVLASSEYYSIRWRMMIRSAGYKILFQKQPPFRRNFFPLSVWYLSFLWISTSCQFVHSSRVFIQSNK